MARPSRPVAVFCIAVIALAAFLPGIWSLISALAEPQWVLLPDDTPAIACGPVKAGGERPLRLLQALPTRGPPTAASA